MIGFYLLAAHMAGDYLFQTHDMAARKLTDWRVRAAHVLVYTLCFVPVLAVVQPGEWRAYGFLAACYVLHFITDSRRWASGELWPPRPILIDQSLHAVQLAVIGGLFLS